MTIVRSTFRSTAALVAMNGIVAIPLIPILWILIHPAPLTFPQLIVFIGIAAIEVFYQFPYYKALRHADTSIVVSLFSLGKIFIPLFAFFIVHERLSSLQYSGFVLIIICSLLISMENVWKIKFNRALIYMIPTAIIIALQTVLEKYNLNTLSVAEFFFWIQLIPLPFYLMLLVRDPNPFPTVTLDPSVTDMFDFRPSHFTLSDYEPHEKMIIPTPV
jgi:drug/metabolite transporter (DMT)-like permease